ncbi:hypothetical protein M9H77_04494 [Catharanthus roseus]|uniref:Uncharacterized protein n=1 Tax=Catharanthus roseus TaxID=4058 RepID=A0ACC0CEC5_CATRO|nr:hypothetical protein M9H77_04494 [Catharanthus roseus]
MAEKDGVGLCTIKTVCPTASAERTVCRYTIRPVLGEELKANVQCLHIETGLPIPTNEQLMFKAAGGSNKGHVYGFSLHSISSSVSSAKPPESYIEKETRLRGYMQQAQKNFVGFMTSFASQCGVQLDSVPTLFTPFRPSDDDATS